MKGPNNFNTSLDKFRQNNVARRIKVRRKSKGFKITTYKMGFEDGFNYSSQKWFEDGVQEEQTT